MEGTHGAGKGDSYRHVNYASWCKNWDEIFKKDVKATKRKSSNSKKHKPLSRRKNNSKGE